MPGDIAEETSATNGDELLAGGYAFVGAVHSLVRADRSPTKFDLILAAACHSLRDGDKSVEELHGLVSRVWPGARVDAKDVESALVMGEELGLAHPVITADEARLWQLTPRGVDDVQRQADWVSKVRKRTGTALEGRALKDLGLTITPHQAELWLERIVSALVTGITASQDAYLGKVDHLVGRRLSPRKVDRRLVLSHLDEIESDPSIVEFLKACTLAALDPLDPFGDELVSHITTGCVLHSYVAGRESAPVLDALGTPAGQRALIDTPVLLDLIGPTRVSRTVALTIKAAVSAGWDVIVCEHSIDELIRVVDVELPQIRQQFQQAHARGIKEEWYASLSADQLASYAIEVLRDGTYRSLDQMLGAARAVSSRLEELGVTVRDHFNDNDRANVDRCRAALDIELAGSHRSTNAIQRDAESMAIIWRRRRRQGSANRWPGGWIITPDRHLSAPYASLERSDKVAISLSLAQWSTLLSVTVPPADVVSLAEAAATQLVEEAMWLLPSRFPSEVALELAERLSPQRGGSETDIRYAQMTLDLALDADKNERSANAIAADVLEARTKRQERITRLELETTNAALATAEASRVTAQSLASARENEARSARAEVESSNLEISALKDRVNWQRDQLKRVLWSVAMGLTGLTAIAIAIAIDAWTWIVVGMAIAFFGGVWVLYRWCSSPEAKLSKLVWAATAQAIGLASACVGLIVDLSGA
ncbi:hypothetical protein [Microbacterium sp. LWH11-1.2]|uniref:hypothetical protein n=1 Tax=unclassified Microbacterium TaxID=2609290 RepID=UPI00313A3FF7